MFFLMGPPAGLLQAAWVYLRGRGPSKLANSFVCGRSSERDGRSKKTARRRSLRFGYRINIYAAIIRRRRQAINPPSAITRPGRPAPTIGPGTEETAVNSPN